MIGGELEGGPQGRNGLRPIAEREERRGQVKMRRPVVRIKREIVAIGCRRFLGTSLKCIDIAEIEMSVGKIRLNGDCFAKGMDRAFAIARLLHLQGECKISLFYQLFQPRQSNGGLPRINIAIL